MTDIVDLSLTPSCNTRLANLCGAMDGNIAHIARTFGVDIRRRGDRFSLRGAAAEEAAATLRRLYARARQNMNLADIQMEIGGGTPAPLPVKSGGRFMPRTAAQGELMQKIMQNSVVFCAGPAGTGKTHVALAAALQLLQDGEHERLVLTRPAVEAGGERIGFLPGDMEQKVNPYLRPLHEILYRLLGRNETERRTAAEQISVIPLSFMRGLTIDDAVIVLDEAQNTTPAQMKMTLTRIGINGRMIVAGDESQSDLEGGGESGLSDAIRRLDDIAGIAMHRFYNADIVRHPLVKSILGAYQLPARKQTGVAAHKNSSAPAKSPRKTAATGGQNRAK